MPPAVKAELRKVEWSSPARGPGPAAAWVDTIGVDDTLLRQFAGDVLEDQGRVADAALALVFGRAGRIEAELLRRAERP